MGQKRSAENCGGGSGSSRADGGARSSELGADKEQNVFLSRASLSSGGQGGGPASGSMHPPVQRQHLRGNVVNLAVESSGRSGNNVGGADGGLGPWRSLPLYAVLRRVSTQEAPSTATLPDEIPLSPPFKPVTFGRHRNRDVHLDCPRVPSLLSRDHAQITVDAQGTHFLEDKNTLNGTYLNGNLIPKGPCALQHGDVIAFGGPANVLRDNKTLRNSFRYEYHQPLSYAEWNAAAASARVQVHSEEAAHLASAEYGQEAHHRPAKRVRSQNADIHGGCGGVTAIESGEGTLMNANLSAQSPPRITEFDDKHLHSQSTQSTQPTQPTSLNMPEADDDLAVKSESLGNDDSTAHPAYRNPGKAVIKLSQRDLVSMWGISKRNSNRTREFLCDALSQTGKSLAEAVVPLTIQDEAALIDVIAKQDSALFPTLRDALGTNIFDARVTSFLTEVCQEALVLHVSPTGIVSFGMKLHNSRSVKMKLHNFHSSKKGDLIAEAVALALWPKRQSAKREGEEPQINENFVFTSSVSEIDGHDCDIGSTGCKAIAEGILSPRRTLDGISWVFNESLRKLALGKNPSLGDIGASALASALKPKKSFSGDTCGTWFFNTTLTVLDLSSCGIGPEGAMAIADALKMVAKSDGDWIFPSNLRALKLSGNRIETKGARAIASLLGPKENKKTGKWTFNPSLAVIDISDNFSGINDMVAEAFAKALKPRPVKTSKESGDNGDVKRAYSTNTALIELHLCGHTFRDGVKMIQQSLNPEYNGSDGAVGAPVRVVFEHPRRDQTNELKVVVDAEGHGHELVMAFIKARAAERRILSYWDWRPWGDPSSLSKDDPGTALEAAQSTESEVELPKWYAAMSEDHDLHGSMLPLSVRYAFRHASLQHLEGHLEGMGTAGLPQVLVDEMKCVICTEVFINPHAVHGCGHRFCHDCISHWLSTRSNQCPICRHRLQLPTSMALTPCHMSQRLLDHYVLPYLSPKDVEVRLERAHEVRENAQKAAEARRASAGGEGSRANSVAAAAAIAMVASGMGTASFRVSEVSQLSQLAVLQQLIQNQTQRALRAAQEANENDANEPGEPVQGRGNISTRQAVTNSLRPALHSVLRSLQEDRRRREEPGANLPTSADQGTGTSLDSIDAAPDAPGAPAAAHQPDWKAVSSSVEIATPCHHCHVIIPPRFLRVRRTLVISGVSTVQYFHANYDCLRSVHHEICGASSIAVLPELSEQEKRVVNSLRAVVSNSSDVLSAQRNRRSAP